MWIPSLIGENGHYLAHSHPIIFSCDRYSYQCYIHIYHKIYDIKKKKVFLDQKFMCNRIDDTRHYWWGSTVGQFSYGYTILIDIKRILNYGKCISFCSLLTRNETHYLVRNEIKLRVNLFFTLRWDLIFLTPNWLAVD